MSRRVLLPIRLDGGLSRGLGYFGAGDIAAQRNRPPQDHPSDRGQTSAHAHAAMRSTVIFGVVGSGTAELSHLHELHGRRRKPLLDLKTQRLLTLTCHVAFNHGFPPAIATERRPLIASTHFLF